MIVSIKPFRFCLALILTLIWWSPPQQAAPVGSSVTATPVAPTPVPSPTPPVRQPLSPERRQEMVKALKHNGVYVAPEMLKLVTPEDIATHLRNSRSRVYAIVVEEVPAPYRSVGQWAVFLHGFLKNSPGITIVVASTQVGFHADGIDKKSEQNLILGASRTFDAEGYAAGIAQIVRNVNYLRAARARARLKLLIVSLAGLVALGVGGVVWWRGYRKRQIDNERSTVRAEAAQLVVSVKQLDAQLADEAGKETHEERKANLNQHRAKLRQILTSVKQQLDAATSLESVEAARANLGEVEAEMLRASASLQHPADLPPPTHAPEPPAEEEAEDEVSGEPAMETPTMPAADIVAEPAKIEPTKVEPSETVTEAVTKDAVTEETETESATDEKAVETSDVTIVESIDDKQPVEEDAVATEEETAKQEEPTA